jgi:mediator of RNA polymerase II transcription subunit 16
MVALAQLSPGECLQLASESSLLTTSKEAQTTFIGEVYRALPINCNFTAEQDKLMSHPYIPRCLSLQAGLGFKGRLKRRNLSSAVPWATIQLRHASVLFAYFFQYNKGGQTESHDPGKLKANSVILIRC